LVVHTDSAVGIIYGTVMVTYWMVANVKVNFVLEHDTNAQRGLEV
jgi:hypothetical protein